MEKQHNKIMPFTHIGEEYTGYSLPVTHPEFKINIEKKIWPHVLYLISQGVETVGSCEGHGFFNDDPHVCFKSKHIDFYDHFVKYVIEDSYTFSEPVYKLECKFTFLHNSIQRYFLMKAIKKYARMANQTGLIS
jgi:hypothetical protein